MSVDLNSPNLVSKPTPTAYWNTAYSRLTYVAGIIRWDVRVNEVEDVASNAWDLVVGVSWLGINRHELLTQSCAGVGYVQVPCGVEI